MTSKDVSRHCPRQRVSNCSRLANSKVSVEVNDAIIITAADSGRQELKRAREAALKKAIAATLRNHLYQPPLCVLSQLKNRSLPLAIPRTRARDSEYLHIPKQSTAKHAGMGAGDPRT